jgi:hypothetical protein
MVRPVIVRCNINDHAVRHSIYKLICSAFESNVARFQASPVALLLRSCYQFHCIDEKADFLAGKMNCRFYTIGFRAGQLLDFLFFIAGGSVI